MILGVSLGHAARAAPNADEPATPCARDPIGDGDVHALARAAATADATTRLAAVHRLAGRLAVNRAAPVKSKLDGDVIVQWIEPVLPITVDAVEALATAVADPDPAVRACAATAIQLDLLAFTKPLRPPPDLAVRPEVARTLIAQLGTREEPAALGLVLAAGRSHRMECDPKYWIDVLPALPSNTLVTLVRRALTRHAQEAWRDPICALLAGVVHVAASEQLIDPLLEAMTSERDRDFSRAHVDAALEALPAMFEHGIPADREPRVLELLIHHGTEVPAIQLMAKLRQPASLRRAGAFLVGLLADPNTTPFEAAAAAAASIRLADIQRATARRFAAVLAHKQELAAMQSVARAIPQLTDPAAQAITVGPLTAVARSTTISEDTRAPAIIALGSVTRTQPTLDVLLALLADPVSRIRAAAADALGSIPDASLQDTALPALIKAVDDPDLGVRVDAVKSLGQVTSPAAQAKARAILVGLPPSTASYDQRRAVAECAVHQLDGQRPRAARCDY